MSTLSITAKGQLTLRKAIMKHLGVRAGDKVDVDILPNGRVAIRAVRPAGKVSDAFGLLHRPDGPRLSIKEMNEVIAGGWAGER